MTIDLDALERIAQAATPGPWDIEYEVEHYDYGPSERWPSTLIGPRRNPPGVLAEKYGNRINEIAELRDEDAEHIAAFDPPTALALIARIREAEREMHARELHHFEEEKLRAEAEAERDRYRNAIEAATAVPNEFEWDVPPTEKHILTRALSDKEAEK